MEVINEIVEVQEYADVPHILPHEKVFQIQVGPKLFTLSGASLSSDAPSYFTQFFLAQIQRQESGEDRVRTLHIDRDPKIFRDISRHLQGYHVTPSDEQHFVYLFADAQLYQLPKLISQLFSSEIFISIGSRPFSIPRDLFSQPGDSPNYFSLGFAVFFSSPHEVFPGLDRDGLLRPPSILPPAVPNRSADVFAELLHLLRGYPLQIRSEIHRQELLRDCRYFQFKGLEQRLIPHHISYNPLRGRTEIVIRLEDIKPSGLSIAVDGPPFSALSPSNAIVNSKQSTPGSGTGHFSSADQAGWITYSRPFVDEAPAKDLILEIKNFIILPSATHMASFAGTTAQRIKAFLQVIASKLNLPASINQLPLTEIKVILDKAEGCYVSLDGREWDGHIEDGTRWVAARAHFRIWAAANGDITFIGMSIDASKGETGRNGRREYLGES